MKGEFDVVVVGAGPAGSTAARVAAERGLSVLLIDRARFPRHKPCAGGVTAKSLRELGFGIAPSLIEHEIRGIEVVSSRGGRVVGRDERYLGVTVRRAAFDRFLATKAVEAGATFLDGAELGGLEMATSTSRGRYAVATNQGEFSAKAVVGADGAAGKTARLAGIRQGWSRWDLGASLSAEVEFPEGVTPERDPELIELHLVPPLRCAFGWVFHRRRGMHVGVGATALDAAILRDSFDAHLARVMRAMNLNLPRPAPKGCVLPMGGLRRRIASQRVLLVGDAAGFVDPFSGEGIYHAIRSGRIAADVLAEDLAADGRTCAEAEYTRRCRREFAQELGLSTLLAAVLGRKDGLPFALLEANPRLVFLLADILYRAGSYRRLFAFCLPRLPILGARLAAIRLGLGRGPSGPGEEDAFP